MAAANILKIKSLAFERNDALLFEPVSFELNSGEALHVEGANGAGKTTLFQLLIKMLEPCSGELLFRGQPVSECHFEYLSDILFIGHQSAVKLTLTAEENLAWMAESEVSSAASLRALESLGLGGYSDIPCYKLSAGQQRRVALARLLLSDARLWYLDEPFTAIGRDGVKLLERCMEDHVSSGGAVVVSTHQDLDVQDVRRYSVLGEPLLRAYS